MEILSWLLKASRINDHMVGWMFSSSNSVSKIIQKSVGPMGIDEDE